MRASVVALLANHSINTTRPLMPDAPSVAGKTEAAVCGDSKMLSWPARRRPSSIQHCWRGAGPLSSRPSSAALDDLRRHEGVTFRGLSSFQIWTFERDGAPVVVEPRQRVAVNDMGAAVEAALMGLGILRAMSYNVADAIRSGALRPVLEGFAPKPAPISLVYPGRGLMPIKVRAFLDWMAPRLRARLG